MIQQNSVKNSQQNIFPLFSQVKWLDWSRNNFTPHKIPTHNLYLIYNLLYALKLLIKLFKEGAEIPQDFLKKDILEKV